MAARVERDDRRPAVALAPVQRGVGVAVEVVARQCSAPGRRTRRSRPRTARSVPLGSPPLTADGEDAPRRRPGRSRRRRPAAGSRTRRHRRGTPGRRAAGPTRSTRPTASSSRSPPAWPFVSLTTLRSSTSISSSASGRSIRFGDLELARELVLERAVVAEAGQAVDQRVVARPAVQAAAARRVRARARRPRAGSRMPSQARSGGRQKAAASRTTIASPARPDPADENPRRRDAHEDAERPEQRPDQPAANPLDAIRGRGWVAVHRRASSMVLPGATCASVVRLGSPVDLDRRYRPAAAI